MARKNAEPEVTDEAAGEETATVARTTTRQIEEFDEPPAGLRGTGGGRTRTPTEFDDQIPAWMESGKWKKIPVDDADDLKYVYNAVKRAADLHEVGIDRLQKDDEGEPMAVWVKVRPKQKRGPAVGSKRIDGKVYGPDELDEDGNPTEEARKRKNAESNGSEQPELQDA